MTKWVFLYMLQNFKIVYVNYVEQVVFFSDILILIIVSFTYEELNTQ